MTTLGGITFHDSRYDSEADVLYLRVEAESSMDRSASTPEGHVALLDDDGQLIGLTIVNARWLLERDGEIKVTLPQLHGPASALAEALG
jgi:uncharacterized protein YuzE